jgi:hypothetical protein
MTGKLAGPDGQIKGQEKEKRPFNRISIARKARPMWWITDRQLLGDEFVKSHRRG